MATWCLIPEKANEFKKALKDGTINPMELAAMSSEARNIFLSKFVGTENVKQVNALFESKILLKNQKAGYISWAKSIAGITPQTKMDIISKIERMDKVLNPPENEQFLKDLAEKRLKVGVSQEEAKAISDLSKKISDSRALVKSDFTFPTIKEKFDYGMAKLDLEKYINDLKLKAKSISFREEPIRKIKSVVGELPGTFKSLISSIDNSFWGRQGIKTLLDPATSGIWFKNFLKSWIDIGRELKGTSVSAMDLIKADIYSRPNAINGKYDAGNYGLNVLSEEAFPSSIPERIPLFNRLYKASEAAYAGGALRMRADLADKLIKMADAQGVNTLDRSQAMGIGRLVSSLTGRGSLGRLEPVSKEINILLFSIKFFKANLDTLTAHRGIFGFGSDKKVMESKFARKESAKSTLRIIAAIASVLTIAKILNKDSVDEDPRSTNFGKVKIFGQWTDITGGMASIARLAARLVPTYHDGQFGFWSKSSTGKWTNLTAGKYGQQTALDVFENYWEGKLSPIAGLVRDILTGKDFNGNPVTLKSAITSLTVPLTIQNLNQLKNDPNSEFVLGSIILDGLGLSVSSNIVQTKTNWETSTSNELQQFKGKIGIDKFRQANDDFNRNYNDWFNAVSKTTEYGNLTDDEKSSLNTKAKDLIKNKIFKEYKFIPVIKKDIKKSINIKPLLPK